MNERAPNNLTPAARKFWKKVVSTYQLRADDLRVLEDACREMGLVDRFESELASAPMMVEGYKGQPVMNPLIAELRQHRSILRALLKQLKLPDEDERAASQSRTTQARGAANQRWRRSS